jgi:alpha-D-ribose 1-methylphosphonate 5-triphosphate synthase subunit PhnI
MAYVAVKGGQEAIEESLSRLKYQRLKKGSVLDVEQAEGGLRALIDQVMSEGSLYSRHIAALAIKQAEGSPEEAVFLMRAFRSTLPRKHYSFLVDTEEMLVERRISASFKDIPGGQILGASPDYSHRLIDFTLEKETGADAQDWLEWYQNRKIPAAQFERLPKVVEYLRAQGLMKSLVPLEEEPKDVTKQSLRFPTKRSERLQILTRGQTGAVTALGYASLRGWGGGALHPTVGELRVGSIPLTIPNPYGDQEEEEDGYYLGDVRITEVETFMPVHTKVEGKEELNFDVGYGACFGQNETKAIAMSLLDYNLEVKDPRFPTHDEEFVLYHIDSVEATGFISHLKLPHYVTFQSKLESVRTTKKERETQEVGRV